MSAPVPGSGSTESVPTWVSPAQQDAARVASIESVLPRVDGVASVFPPAGAELAGLALEGVKVSDERVEVHIIAEYGRPLQATADDIDRAVQPLLDGRNLQIVVDDILLPGERLPDPGSDHPTPSAEQSPPAATDVTPPEDVPGTEVEEALDASESVAVPDPKPQTGVTVTVAPETAAEVTITTDQQGAVQVDVPATTGADSDTTADPSDERTAGV